MKEERRTLLLSAILNFIIATVKLIGGLLCGVNALLADSIYTFCNSITDIISIIGSKLSSKRPTRYHPFGFGRVEYLTNLFISLLLFFVGSILFVHSFELSDEIPSLVALYTVIIAIIIKVISVHILKVKNAKLKSPAIKEGINEANIDIISTVFVGLVIVILQFKGAFPPLKYADLIVSLLVVGMIYKSGYTLMKYNIIHILGYADTDGELVTELKTELEESFNIKVDSIELIKYGRYYKAHVVLLLPASYTLKRVDEIENKVASKLRHLKRINVRVVNIESNAIKKEDVNK